MSPAVPETPSPSAALVLRRIALVLALLLCCFWGTFLVHHLSEWFFRRGALPSRGAWQLVLAHALLVASLAALWRWERAASVAVILSATAFFAQTAGPMFLPFLAVTSVPAVMLRVSAGIDRRLARRGRMTSS